MKKVVIAIDSMKGSLSSIEAGQAFARGVRQAVQCEIAISPLADGGEGTAEALVEGLGGVWKTVVVQDPAGNPVTASYGWIAEEKKAIIEIAAAAGLTLVPPEARDIRRASSGGIGMMIRHAVSQGCRDFIIGIGGSAVNDCGIGMLHMLGVSFLDHEGRVLGMRGEDCGAVASISTQSMIPELRECRFQIACDVKNPLYGSTGASFVFGPQKGGTQEDVEDMEKMHRHFARKTYEVLGKDCADYPGAGAAGGLGFAFLAYLGADLEPGIEIVMRATGLEEQIRDADYVVTGEGCLDAQSVMGKAPIGVARIAKKYGVPVLAVAGSILPESRVCNEKGIDAYFSILPRTMTPKEAMDKKRAEEHVQNTAEQLFRLLAAAEKKAPFDLPGSLFYMSKLH